MTKASEPSSGWEHFDHGADIGIRGYGPSAEAAFEQAALAMTAAMTDPQNVATTEAVDIQCDANGLEDLFFSWLNALVFEMATRDMLFGRFAVRIQDHRLSATAWGETVDPGRHQPAAEIKGPTYTAMSVRQNDGLWIAECVVDV